MKNKVIRLNENDIENLVRKIIKEEESKPEVSEPKKKVDTVTKHDAYKHIDALKSSLGELERQFQDEIANRVSGTDGYHSVIDKFSEDFSNFITKVTKLKSKINQYQLDTKELRKKKVEEKKASYMAQHNMRKENARRQGKYYSK